MRYVPTLCVSLKMITLTVEIVKHESSEGDNMILLLFEHVVSSRIIISSIDVLRQNYHQLNWCAENGSGTRKESFAKRRRYSPIILVVHPNSSAAQLLWRWWTRETRKESFFAKWGGYSLISNPLPNSLVSQCCEESRSVFLIVVPGVSKLTQNHSFSFESDAA